MFSLTRRVRVLLLVLVLVIVSGAVAFAYWTNGGSGSGSGATGTTVGVTVNQTSNATGLYPGGSAALSGDFTNPNSSSVFVAAVSASVTPFSVQADSGKPACTQADFAVTGSAPVAAQVAPGSGVGSWSGLTLTMTNAATNQDNCKNITVPITYTSS